MAERETFEALPQGPLNPGISEFSQRVVDSLRIELLESVNSQLGFLTNPYGLMVAALGTLFAIGAIVATVILWRQSKAYQKTIDDAIAKYKEVLTALLEERVAEAKASLDEQIKGAQKQLDDLKGENTAAIEAEIAKLKSTRARLDSPDTTLFVTGSATGSAPPAGAVVLSGSHYQSIAEGWVNIGTRRTKTVACANCGHHWKVETDPNRLRFNWSEECPKCRTKQWVDTPLVIGGG